MKETVKENKRVKDNGLECCSSVQFSHFVLDTVINPKSD